MSKLTPEKVIEDLYAVKRGIFKYNEVVKAMDRYADLRLQELNLQWGFLFYTYHLYLQLTPYCFFPY